jgi:hypothetical protein
MPLPPQLVPCMHSTSLTVLSLSLLSLTRTSMSRQPPADIMSFSPSPPHPPTAVAAKLLLLGAERHALMIRDYEATGLCEVAGPD